MNLGKLLNKDWQIPDNSLKQALILAALAVIVMGFGNGLPALPFQYGEQYGTGNMQNAGMNNPEEEHKKKKHKHHHKDKPEAAHTNTPPVEDNNNNDNDKSEESLNTPYASYTIE